MSPNEEALCRAIDQRNSDKAVFALWCPSDLPTITIVWAGVLEFHPSRMLRMVRT